ncbi:MAG: DDE-type integrase/transposase/recombinase, partial [Mesoflavibacter sp.]|nr:DDE-type integrase/transposase/recombinase [Mesoflavibacter sp.]
LGFVSPAILQGKLFIQSLWNLNLDWDTPIPDEKVQEWNSLCDGFSDLKEYSLLRYIGLRTAESTPTYTLIAFADASGKAYAAVIYLKVECEDKCSTSLLFSKTRVAPKNATIPRLELLGLLIAVRSLQFCKQQLQILVKELHVFTDSECVLKWMTTTKPMTKFVLNRLSEIKKHDDVVFHYVSTSENPADYASRGMPFAKLRDTPLWWSGPEWLHLPAIQWPINNVPEITADVLQKITSEEKVPKTSPMTSAFVIKSGIDKPLVEYERFSKLHRLLSTMTYVLRFLRNCSKNLKRGPLISTVSETGTLTATDLTSALTFVLRDVQHSAFDEVFDAIMSTKRHSLVQKLNLFVDDKEILRLQGRIDKAVVPTDMQRPALLPRKHALTKLIVQHYHTKLHAGVTQTLAQVRLQFWIPKGRIVVRQILRHCVTCRRLTGGTYNLPAMPQLPADRLRRARPFQYCGIDYFGHLWVKEKDSEARKVWGCLFTCLTTRAVHLEIVNSLKADDFLDCLRRFIARRAMPERILSDNAKQFKLVHQTLSDVWSTLKGSDVFTSYCALQGIQWNYIPERAPWQGGVYERLVGVVKAALKKAIGRRFLSYNEL